MKPAAKKVLQKSASLSKRVLKRNKHARRLFLGVRNNLFPGVFDKENIYDHRAYYPTPEDYYHQINNWQSFKQQPLISVVVPTYNTPENFLRKCIESVIVQSYPNWELCIADDNSSDKNIAKIIKEYQRKDKRIKLTERTSNGHISAASNSAIDIASGDYISLLDHDDLLWPNALYEVVQVINEHPDADFIYSDEDKINAKGDTHSFPFLKPEWSPEFLESCNYITHFSTIRADIVHKVGGFRKGYEGAQDWDLFMRVSEITPHIYHVPKVLYSWRIHEASTAHNTDAKPYVYEAQRQLLRDHVERTSRGGEVEQGIIKQHSRVQYSIGGEPKVTIIVYAQKPEDTKHCLHAIAKTNTYQNCEILVMLPPKHQRSITQYVKRSRITQKVTLHSDENITSKATAINMAAGIAKGEYLVWVDTAVQPTTPSWLEVLLADAQRKGVGVVGAKLINGHSQAFYRQAGVGLGIDDFCGDLLGGVSLDDIHYMRGLYGQSRRNVAAVRGILMVKKTIFNQVKGMSTVYNNEWLGDIDFCLKVLKKGYRNIYNPYVEALEFGGHYEPLAGSVDVTDKTKFKKAWHELIAHDPFLNPNFSRVGSHLNIK